MKLSDKLRTLELSGRISEHPNAFIDLPAREIPTDVREELLALGDASAAAPIPILRASLYADFCRNGNRSEYEGPYFERRRMLTNLATALWISGDGKYADPMLDVLWAILEETTWVLPAHQFNDRPLPVYDGADTHNLDLFSAATAGNLVFVYLWHRERLAALSHELVERMEQMLRERILRPFMKEDWMFWMKGANNWTPWIISNVYTVLLMPYMTADEREAVIRRSLPMLAAFADTYHEDGGCDEGPSYWGKAGGSLFDCFELLYDLSDGKIDLFDDPLLKNMGEYFAKAYIHGGYMLNFADAPGVPGGDGILASRFGRRIHSPELEAYGCSLDTARVRVAPEFQSAFGGFRDISHTSMYRLVKDILDIPKPVDKPPLFPKVWLDGLQVMAVRENPADSADGLFFACKGGHNAENHNHNDVGSFIVYQDGEPLFPDLGVGTYTKFTFAPETRYRIFSMRSLFHNLMEVGDGEQKPGGEYHAETVSQENGTVCFELKNALPAETGCSSWRRTMGMEGGVIRIRDEVSLERADSLCWHIISFEKPEITGGAFRFAKAELCFDPSLTAGVEEHVFDDGKFIETWGKDKFYRMILKTQDKLSEGDFTLTVRKR